jgi:Domain of unknown function (DUF4388)
MDPSSPQVTEAVEELKLYLSDILPPLVVSDAFKLLIQFPPSFAADRLREWISSQYRPGVGITLSDYAFYAMKKVNMMAEFHLVPREQFDEFLEALKTLVLDLCPPEERDALRENLTRLSEAGATLTRSVDALIRPRPGPGGLPAESVGSPSASAEELRGLRHFSMLLRRIGSQVPAEGAADPGVSSDFARAVTAAARASRTPKEFEQNLGRLRELGWGTEALDIFRALGSSLPGWVALEPRPVGGEAGEGSAGPEAPESGPVEAMHRLVVQAEDPAEVARRFNAMVKSAIERFNEGALPQAVMMLGLAERIVAEKRVDAATVEAVRQKGGEEIDPETLRNYSEAPRFHGMLGRFLAFFAATSPKGLLADLLGEMKRDRRRLILQLLEIHGAPAREEALERLRAPIGQGEGDEKWYFRRNLLYLLRKIPARRDDPLNDDVDRAVRHADLRFPAALVKEAVANLGQLKHDRAEATLLSLVGELEGMLIKPAEAFYDPRESRLLLDRVVKALARFGTPKARAAVVDHGLRNKAELGDTTVRLSELAGQDLSGDPELVEQLLAALKANAPRKVLGMRLHGNDLAARHIIEALSATPSPPVRSAFENLAGSFPGSSAGKAASTALSGLDQAVEIPEAPPETRSGDLETFGLPVLIQSLAEPAVSGTLTLKNAREEIRSEIVLRDSRMKSCETGGMTGEEAFYQLFERPAPGSYLLTLETGDGGEDTESFKEILPLCREGMRRYDELQETSAVVPDGSRLKGTDVRPEHHPDELDGIFVNGLWKLASGGSTPRECEEALKVGAYRVRRQLASWVEGGALTGT